MKFFKKTNLQQWADDWGMRFNANKCYILSIKNKYNKFYSLNNHILQQVDSNPYLGYEMAFTRNKNGKKSKFDTRLLEAKPQALSR